MNTRPSKRTMVFIDGGYVREYFKHTFHHENINYNGLSLILRAELGSSDLIRTYYYDGMYEKSETHEYERQNEYVNKIREIPHFEVRLGRLKKCKKGNFRQKGVDTLIALDMLSKAYENQYDVAGLISGDDDLLDVVMAVKNTGKVVYGVYFAGHISDKLKYSFDRRVGMDQNQAQSYCS